MLPGSTGGDFIKGLCIYRRTPGKRVAAVMTVLVDRVVGLISLMIIGTVAALIQADDGDLKGISQTSSWILGAIMGGGAIFFSARLRKLLKVAEIVERLPFKKRIKEVDQSVFHYRNHLWMLGGNVAISFLIHATTIFCIYLVGRSLQLTIPLMFYFEALPVIFTAGAFFPAIGGLGILESLFAHFFVGQGATASSAVALCILYRLMILVGSLPGAIFTYREFSAHGIPKISGDEELDDPGTATAASMSLTC
ncbi:MAG: lysylphosphatidylglycerol synthase transmembrane domain-containing protein [Planctomycetota bacterium]